MTGSVLRYRPMTPEKQILPQRPAGPSAPLPEHEALLREIAEDARREPERYLADSVVPKGGE